MSNPKLSKDGYPFLLPRAIVAPAFAAAKQQFVQRAEHEPVGLEQRSQRSFSGNTPNALRKRY